MGRDRKNIFLLFFISFIISNSLTSADSIEDRCKGIKREKCVSYLEDASQELRIILEELMNNGTDTCNETVECEDITRESYEDPIECDIIIIGAGVSGSILANRLSEMDHHKVCVFEKGCYVSPISRIPGLSAYTFFSNWTKIYRPKPQKNFGKGLRNNQLSIPMGCGLGGSSNIVSGRINRGSLCCYDGIPIACRDLIYYYKKTEECRIEYSVKDSHYHCYDGKIAHEDNRDTETSDAFMRCAIENGCDYIDDLGRSTEGVAKIKIAADEGFKQSHYDAYLAPILKRKNVKIFCHSIVTKVLINENKTAYGIIYKDLNNRTINTAYANKTIIIAAGTFETPRILFNSGIGLRKDLNDSDIPVVCDSPVGKCVRQNVAYQGIFLKTNNSDVPRDLEDLFSNSSKTSFCYDADGLLATAAGEEAVKILSINSTCPNCLISLKKWAFNIDGGIGLAKIKGFNNETMEWMKELIGQKIIQLEVIYNQCSCGTLKFSNNSCEDPELKGYYLQDPVDKENLLECIKETLRLINCTSFQNLGIQLWNKPHPKCRNKNTTDDFLNCQIEILTTTNGVPIGSARIGEENDTLRVVDEKQKVIGFENLYCAGHSVVPIPFLGDTIMLVSMMTERLADIIKMAIGCVPRDPCSCGANVTHSYNYTKFNYTGQFGSSEEWYNNFDIFGSESYEDEDDEAFVFLNGEVPDDFLKKNGYDVHSWGKNSESSESLESSGSSGNSKNSEDQKSSESLGSSENSKSSKDQKSSKSLESSGSAKSSEDQKSSESLESSENSKSSEDQKSSKSLESSGSSKNSEDQKSSESLDSSGSSKNSDDQKSSKSLEASGNSKNSEDQKSSESLDSSGSSKNSEDQKSSESLDSSGSSKSSEDQKSSKSLESSGSSKNSEDQKSSESLDSSGSSKNSEDQKSSKSLEGSGNSKNSEDQKSSESLDSSANSKNSDDQKFSESLESPETKYPEVPKNPESPEISKDPVDPNSPESPENPEIEHPVEKPVFQESPETSEEVVVPESPATPEEPVNPENPDTPVEPVAPESPETSEEVVVPESPATPEEPVHPENPDTPVEPVAPESPETSEEVVVPESPATPEEPVNPENPETPVEPVAPESPETSEEVVVPESPATPEEPVNPENPETPVEPVAPESPETSEEVVVPESPATPEEPVNPENPETPVEPVAPESPETSEEVVVPESPATPEEPVHPENPDTPVEPVFVESPETSEELVVPESPATPEEPVHPENPDTPVEPVVTESPETPEEVVVPENPETPEYQVIPESPVQEEIPVEPVIIVEEEDETP